MKTLLQIINTDNEPNILMDMDNQSDMMNATDQHNIVVKAIDECKTKAELLELAAIIFHAYPIEQLKKDFIDIRTKMLDDHIQAQNKKLRDMDKELALRFWQAIKIK